MADFESLLNRWQSAGVLDAEAAARIRIYEAAQQGLSGTTTRKPERVVGVAWQGRVALILGAILLASGIALFVSAHWDQLGPGLRYTIVIAMVTVFHLGGAMAREKYCGLSTALHAVGTASTGAAIALVGQIFNIQEHWPAAILLWAVAALAGWILLRDQAQQTLTLLLFPAWILCEWSFSAKDRIGFEVYSGRFLIAWALLYLTVFLGSKRKMVRGILFDASRSARPHGANHSFPTGGAMKLAKTSIGLLVFQLAIVSSIAAKYFYQRATCPRVWTHANTYDPSLLMRGRYLSLQLTVDGCGSTLPSARQAQFPRNLDGVPGGTKFAVRSPIQFQATLGVKNNKLVAARLQDPDNTSAGQTVAAWPGASCDALRLAEPVDFYIPEHAADPTFLRSGQELWIEVTVPPKGPPRPLQLALKDNGTWKPLAFE